MTTIEQTVKAQFEKVFTCSDWGLFKKMAESNLHEAATLLKSDMPIESSLKLLARNARKRLFIGIGVELLLKAIYLKEGYVINKPQKGSPLRFPFAPQDAIGAHLALDKTVMLNELIENLPKVVQLQNENLTLKGLKIAKVFRNKEGHGITTSHAFDASNYTDIASSLIELYRDAFTEKLSVQFSLAPNEPAVWRVASLNKRLQGTPASGRP